MGATGDGIAVRRGSTDAAGRCSARRVVGASEGGDGVTLDAIWPAADPPPGADELLTALLRAVSHDLQSPLLTVSLSIELLGDGTGDDERVRVGREAMAHGIQELERMIEAVTAVSRARGRILAPQLLSIGDLLRGHVVVSDAELSQAIVSLDPRCVIEMFAALSGDRPVEVRLRVVAGEVLFSIALPTSMEAFTGYPVHALLTSLQQHAGSLAVVLAAVQTQLERQGGALLCSNGRVHLRIPLVARSIEPAR